MTQTSCAAGKGGPAGVGRFVAELLFDPQELVVLRHAVAPRRRAGLDLADVRRDREVGDRRVLGLAGAVRHDDAVAVRARELDRVERLGQRPDLVHLDEDRVRRAVLDPAAEPFDVRDEDVVADELHAVSEPRA